MPLMPLIGTGGPYLPARPSLLGASFSSSSWPLADRIIYCRLFIPEDFTVLRVWWTNAGTVTGNVNVGLYTIAGTKLWELGSTAASGTNQIQYADMADQAHSAGEYFLAIQKSTTGSLYAKTTVGLNVVGMNGALRTEDAASFALPATATFAMPASAWTPLCGLDLRG